MENLEKNPWSKDENQKQTQPTYDAGSGIRTQATLVESGWMAGGHVSALTTAPSLCWTTDLPVVARLSILQWLQLQ